jgi:hypothetical protein
MPESASAMRDVVRGRSRRPPAGRMAGASSSCSPMSPASHSRRSSALRLREVILDGVKAGDAFERLAGDRRGARRSELVEAPADMGPAFGQHAVAGIDWRPGRVGQGRAIEIDALLRVDLSLPVERQMIDVFGHEHLSRGRGPQITAPPLLAAPLFGAARFAQEGIPTMQQSITTCKAF